jgi:hypothetical protein
MKILKKSRPKAKYTPKTPREIIGITRLILKVIGSTSNLLAALEEIKKLFPKLRITVVSDLLLPDVEARAFPKQWLIRIREGMYRGLLCGDVRARWTLAHELAHIILQHPRRLARRKNARLTPASDKLFEHEADLFAAGLLSPYDRAVNCKTASELAHVFQLSAEAAQFRFTELKSEERRKRIALDLGKPSDTFTVESGHLSHLEDRVALACSAISAALVRTNFTTRLLVEPIADNLLGTAILTATASQLILDAYESVRKSSAYSRYLEAAALAAAILSVRSIREFGSKDHTSSMEAFEINQRCAIGAAGALLEIDPCNTDKIVLSRGNQTSLISFESPFLTPHITFGEGLMTSRSVVLNLGSFPSYRSYNIRNDMCWDDIHQIEQLMNVFMLLHNEVRVKDCEGEACGE